MKRIIVFSTMILLLLGFASGSFATEEKLQFGRFGTVNLYYSTPHPSHVALFVSGDGGWNLGVVDMARELMTLDALIVGIDIVHYVKELELSKESCSYPAADFEALSKYIQKKLGYSRYSIPVLIGYSSGATLVYATLVQAPPTTFRGAVSMGFCPDLPLSKPFCKGQGLEYTAEPKGKGFSFLPASNLEVPWIALQGTIDQVCDPAATDAYVRKVKNASIVLLPKVGHGFSVPKNWMPQFKNAFMQLVQNTEDTTMQVTEELKNLPLIEIPVSQFHGDTFAVIYSGDGGWASIDREVGITLVQHGIPVVGINSLQYFWTPRDPEGAAGDLAIILRNYFSSWHKEKVVLIGYSFGAEVLPFLVNRLPEELSRRIAAVALLGPGLTAEFEFHMSDWLGSSSSQNTYPVRPEVERLREMKLLCFAGEKEEDSLCNTITDSNFIKVVTLPGAHHFGSKYDIIAENIIKEMNY